MLTAITYWYMSAMHPTILMQSACTISKPYGASDNFKVRFKQLWNCLFPSWTSYRPCTFILFGLFTISASFSAVAVQRAAPRILKRLGSGVTSWCDPSPCLQVLLLFLDKGTFLSNNLAGACNGIA